MSSDRRVPAAMLSAAFLVLASCADVSRGRESTPRADGGGEATTDAGRSDAGTLSFATAVDPLLYPTCGRCHVAGQEAGDTELLFTGAAAADYAAVTRFVDTSAPASSRLLSKMSGNGHGGGTVFAVGTPQYETVLEWIQQGAQP